MRKTKIVCTMGPRESDREILAELAKEMDVARFNFSHGTHESHLDMLQAVRDASAIAGRPIATLLDTKGPEIRTVLVAEAGGVELKKGSSVTISPSAAHEGAKCDSSHIYVTYADIARDVKLGGIVLIDDGNIELAIDDISGNDIFCTVITGGILRDRKGVNLPGAKIGLPGLTERDIDDISFGLSHGFDYIAASFVRDAETVEKIRSMIREAGENTKIIAKIESQEGIDNLDEIIEAADGIMVARGDLGVEVDAKKIPQMQRDMIRKCNAAGKLVITATQMLDSMIRNPRPTRAEVTDVANAIYEGSDAIMLSGETASGEYPVEALQMMVSIAEYTERFVDGQEISKYAGLDWPDTDVDTLIADTTCLSAVAAADDLGVRALVAPTSTGRTALMLSKYRPASDIYAFSPDKRVVRQMMLFRGVHPMYVEMPDSQFELMNDCLDILVEKGLADKGDVCVYVAGNATGRQEKHRPASNTMSIVEV